MGGGKHQAVPGVLAAEVAHGVLGTLPPTEGWLAHGGDGIGWWVQRQQKVSVPELGP